MRISFSPGNKGKKDPEVSNNKQASSNTNLGNQQQSAENNKKNSSSIFARFFARSKSTEDHTVGHT